MRKRQKLFMFTMAAVLIVSLLAGCSQSKALVQFSDPKEGQPIATISVKDYGDIKVMLFPEIAPKGVENFITHAKNGYYNGVKFHRVVNDFMIQGGDPEGTGMGGESIWGEGFDVEYDGSLRNFSGALAYANRGAGTNGSQFYIVSTGPVSSKEMSAAIENNTAVKYPDEVKAKYEEIGGSPSLDGDFTVFGQVIEGLDVVQSIMKTETDWDGFGFEQSVPVNDVIIESITVTE